MISRKRNSSSRLRHKLILQQELRTTDDEGGYVRSWKDVAELWAEIIPLSGSEKYFGNQIQAEASHKVVLRYREGVTGGMRLVYEKRAFNIRSVINNGENNESLELLVTEGVAT